MTKAQTSLLGRVVGATVMLLASVTLAALVLHGWRLHSMTQLAELRALEAVAELGATQLLAMGSDPQTHDGDRNELDQQFERWSWAALRQPQVLATAFRDGQGRVRRLMPPDMTIDAALASMPAGGRFSGSCRVDVLGERTRAWVVSAPLGEPDDTAASGSVVILASRVPFSEAWGRWAATFALPLAGVAVIAFAIGLRWLRSQLDQPLRMLARQKNEDEVQWRAHLPIDRDDEIGGIARGTDEMISELADARAQLDQLRRGLHLRVAERTREINRMLQDTQRKVWIDPLTQLGNRRLLDDRLEELFQAQRAAGGPLSVAMFDVDHLKEHNDTHGHAAGDDLLRFLGQLLRGSLRETDVGIRFAGDEFVVLLPDVEPDDAVALANRIVRFFGQQTSVFETDPRPTLSAGIASVPHCGAATGKELLKRADAALYKAKAGGKNAVRLATVGMPARRKSAEHPSHP